jgi:starch synthase
VTGAPALPVGLYYHPDAYVAAGRRRLMGRHSAGAGFLGALLAMPEIGRVVPVADDARMAEGFREAVAAAGRRDLPTDPVPGLRPDMIGAAAPTLVLPDPNLSAHAWRRRRFDQRAYSLCGTTHTTATRQVMDMIADLRLAPVQPWDALVCTSAAVKSMVRSMLDEQAAYLRDRFGAARIPEPQLPVVPLGIDCAAFARDDGRRAQLRARLGMGDGDVAALWLGRLDLRAKASMLPLFLALAEAAPACPGRLHLVLCGWFASDQQERAIREAAAAACPGVSLHALDGRDPETRREALSAADLFAFLVDNVQETFGLAPVEAMAAGLPVVVTDWDGFRDTVPDGVAGYRVPTWAPPGRPFGLDLALLHESGGLAYDDYVGAAAQFAGIDLRAAAEAFRALAADAGMRARMGAAAAAHARTALDWSAVMPRWRAVWDELDAIRRTAPESAPKPADGEAVPARPDPFAVFAAWPSGHVGPQTAVRADGPRDRAARIARIGLPTAALAPGLLPTGDECLAILELLDREGPMTAAAIADRIAPARRIRIARALPWLMKMGLVRPAG